MKLLKRLFSGGSRRAKSVDGPHLARELESAIAEGRNIVVNSSSRARRLLNTLPLPMTEWVEFIRRLSEDVEGYTGRLSQVRRGVAIDDPAYSTLAALQAMLGTMDGIIASADPPAYSVLEPQFAEAGRHLDVAWEALQAPR